MNSNISDDEEEQKQVVVSVDNAIVVKTEGTAGRRRSKSSIMYQKT